jgi:threonine synthase
VAYDLRSKNCKTIILETAQALKFEEVVKKATGKNVPRPKELGGIENKIQKVYIANPEQAAIKDFIVKILKK